MPSEPPSELMSQDNAQPVSDLPVDSDVLGSELPSRATPASAGRRGRAASRSSEPRSDLQSDLMSSPLDFGDVVEATPAPSSLAPRSGSPHGMRSPRSVHTPRSGLGTNLSNELATTRIWGTKINVAETIQRFREFFDDFAPAGAYGRTPIYRQRLEYLFSNDLVALNIDCAHLREYDRLWQLSGEQSLYRNTVQYPQEMISLMDSAANELFSEIAKRQYDADVESGVEPREQTTRVLCHPFNLETTTSMRDLDPRHIDTLLSVHGMVTRTSTVIPDLRVAFFECSLCAASVSVMISNSQIDEPNACVACRNKRCMALVHNRSRFADKQIVKLQEAPDRIPQGETPATITASCWDDLVDVAKPGDRVVLTGVLRAQPLRVNPRQRTCKAIYKTYFDVQHVRKVEVGRLSAEDARAAADSEFHTTFDEAGADDEGVRQGKLLAAEAISKRADVYSALASALAPSIWELDDVKKGILCQLFAGTSVTLAPEEAGGARFRGDLNVLLVGDPGTSKSQLLQYVHKVAPRGVFTSGKGSSAVGLTAYVTKDPESGSFVLESGALVLSDRGVCCIDEFDKMSEGARSVLHEAMEQQTVSIAKAGIICTLNARTSILASANPRESRYNPSLSVIDNIDLPPTLLSRFDLIYLLLDKPAERTDRLLARHLVGLYAARRPAAAAAGAPAGASPSASEAAEALGAEGAPIDQRALTDYISHARQHCHPRLSDEASDLLVSAYVEMRRVGAGRKTISATPRQLESLIRLAEAHARLHLRDVVDKDDVEEATRLMRVATQQSATDPLTGTIDMDLIATGRSAAARGQLDQLAAALLEELRASAAGALSVAVLHAAIIDKAQVHISLGQVREALDQLKGERSINERAGIVSLV